MTRWENGLTVDGMVTEASLRKGILKRLKWSKEAATEKIPSQAERRANAVSSFKLALVSQQGDRKARAARAESMKEEEFC
jgi:hypothetical protein